MAYLFGNFADNNLNGEYMAGLRYKDPPAIVDRTSIEGGSWCLQALLEAQVT